MNKKKKSWFWNVASPIQYIWELNHTNLAGKRINSQYISEFKPKVEKTNQSTNS